MRSTRLWITALLGVWLMAAPAYGQGKKGGGGSTDTSNEKAPATITFRDCQDGLPSADWGAQPHPQEDCPVANDRIRSDTGLAYEDGVGGVEAFIGSAANSGNIWLKVAPLDSPRGLFLDFSECAAGPCQSPFPDGAPAQAWDHANLKVDADAAKKGGVYGMAKGETIHPPMRIYLFRVLDPEILDPAFVDFIRVLKGKTTNICDGSFVTVVRTGDTRTGDASDSWEVSAGAEDLACVSGASGSGTFRMPFRFSVVKK